MRSRTALLVPLLSWLFVLHGCGTTAKGGLQRQVLVAEPAFNADSAYFFVARQVAFGPRIPNTAAARATGDWLIKKLQVYGAAVKVQEFQTPAYDGTVLNLRNIIATYNPQAKTRVLLCAHWDTRPFADKDTVNPTLPNAGANDGASGVGVLLEIARTLYLAPQKPEVGLDLLFFDGEDYGQPGNSGLPYKRDTWCLGAQYWSKNKHVPNYSAAFGVLLDMVGAEGATFAREGHSTQFARQVVNRVWKAGDNIGYSAYFKSISAPGIIDDHYYLNRFGGISTIDIIDHNLNASDGDFFGSYHHRHTDSMDIISRKTLKAVGQTMLHVLYSE